MDIVWLIFLLMLGACVGSFLNVVIYRLPRGESLVFPPSHCPACGRRIRPYDNIPIVSWLALRGRCRFCKSRISPRYIIVEAATAALVGGLYVFYYMLGVRNGAGILEQTWPMFAAHAALLAGLLVCSIVDAETFTIPLEVCWVVTLIALARAAVWPEPFLPRIGMFGSAAAVTGAAGLAISHLLTRFGWLRESFVDASDRPLKVPGEPAQTTIAYSRAHGVDPRKEILCEVLYLLIPIGLVVAAALVLAYWPAASAWWSGLLDVARHPAAAHVRGLLAAVLGYLIGGFIVWLSRVGGTLAFGKEAMGMGDVHLMAAVGAVTGWIVPTVAFFVAPVFGLVWALHSWLVRGRRELPYGPWLAAATVVAMLFYDGIIEFLGPVLGR